MTRNFQKLRKQNLNTGSTNSIFNLWSLITVALTLLLICPILLVITRSFASSGDTWQHLMSFLLPRYVQNSFFLMLGVGSIVSIIGVSTAWLVSMCRFPGRKVFEWALLLPLAMPAYILAYTYTDFLQFSGPFQSLLRDTFEWSKGDYWFPEIRSRNGATLMLSLALFPYVYMLARSSFLEQSSSILEASRSLGRGPWQSFFTISLPLARPAIVAGVALALMETLGDFGTVDYFAVQTFATGIYRHWVSFDAQSKIAAAQLASMLLGFVLTLVLLERISRRSNRYQQQPSSSRYKGLSTYNLRSFRAVGAWLVCFMPICLGFILPALLLLNMALNNPSLSLNSNLIFYARNSLTLAAIAAIITVATALIIAYSVRLQPSNLNKLLSQLAAIGYAVPGSVIAVGVLLSITLFNNSLETITTWLGSNADIFIGGSVVALLFAYVVRFLAVAHGGIDSSLAKITLNMDDAARSLGYNRLKSLWYVHAPMLKNSLLTALLLVFVDVIKELPATLIVRPFNFETLAVRTYRLASDERLVESSGLALAIVLVGIIPVIILSHAISNSRKKQN